MSLIFGLLLLILYVAFSYAWTKYVNQAVIALDQPKQKKKISLVKRKSKKTEDLPEKKKSKLILLLALPVYIAVSCVTYVLLQLLSAEWANIQNAVTFECMMALFWFFSAMNYLLLSKWTGWLTERAEKNQFYRILIFPLILPAILSAVVTDYLPYFLLMEPFMFGGTLFQMK